MPTKALLDRHGPMSPRPSLCVLIFASMIALIGCASSRFDHPALVAGSAPSGQLVLLRKSEMAGGAVALTVQLDRENVAKLRTGTYADLRLTPGTYALSLGGFPSVPYQPLDGLEVEAGTTTYVLLYATSLGISVGVGVSSGGIGLGGDANPEFGFQVIDEDAAQELIAGYDRIGAD